MSRHDVHIVHDASGRILAVAPVDAAVADDGSARGLTPVTADAQFALRLALTEEHLRVGPVVLIREYEVDVAAAGLRRRRR